MPDGTPVTLDNGQHILIGAYSETLRLMRLVGMAPEKVLLRSPLNLLFSDGMGLALPRWPSPLDALGGMLMACGWSWSDKVSLLKAAIGWQLHGFTCPPHTTVADLCAPLTPRVRETLIDPLCVSALNTPASRASGQVFLRVLKDSLFGGPGSSNLLLPTTDLGSVFPEVAASWLQSQGGALRLGERVDALQWKSDGGPRLWTVNGEPFDAVVWATSSSFAALALSNAAQDAPESIANQLLDWSSITRGLQFEAIATDYAWSPEARLSQPMLSLYSHAGTPTQAPQPAQFVFDRGQLGGPAGLLAFVVSASTADRESIQQQVLAQARTQLDLQLQPVRTVVEKRATFACTPALVRPSMQIAPGLLACGDYVDGPYPATLEGAIRSGWAAGTAR